MIERVLILSRDDGFLMTLYNRLKAFSVEVVDAFTEEGQIPDSLRYRYNVIVLDKSFLGHARGAVELIRRMRRAGFSNPIIGVELVHHDGDLFTLAVAGCNFTLSTISRLDSPGVKNLENELALLIERISAVLSEAHQPQ